jgi:hypothetical protein
MEVVHILDHYVIGRMVIASTALELVAFAWIYGELSVCMSVGVRCVVESLVIWNAVLGAFLIFCSFIIVMNISNGSTLHLHFTVVFFFCIRNII